MFIDTDLTTYLATCIVYNTQPSGALITTQVSLCGI